MAEVPTEALEAALHVWWQHQPDGNRAAGAPVAMLQQIVDAAVRAAAPHIRAERDAQRWAEGAVDALTVASNDIKSARPGRRCATPRFLPPDAAGCISQWLRRLADTYRHDDARIAAGAHAEGSIDGG